MRDAAQLLWIVNLGCIDLNPHPVRADDLDHPDELRVDLDPGPGVGWDDVRQRGAGRARRARRARPARLAEDLGLARHPRQRAHRAALDASTRCAARRWRSRARSSGARPELATSKWWKEERHGVFLDYNQNAKDRTVASAWSVRPTPDARVSMPLDVGRGRRLRSGGVHAASPRRRASPSAATPRPASTTRPGSLDALLELSAAQEAAGPRRRAVAAALHASRRGEPPRVRRRGARAARPHRARTATGRRAVDAAARSPSRRRSTRTTRSPASSAGRRGTPRPRRCCRSTTCSSTRCAAARRTWTRIRVNLRHVPEGERPAEEPPDPDYDPWRGCEPRAPSRARRRRAPARRPA